MAGFAVLAIFPRTRDTRREFLVSLIICDLYSVPIGQPKKKDKACDKNRQEGKQAAIEVPFHLIQVYRISPITKTTLLRGWFLLIELSLNLLYLIRD
jgi:hypothetical protein